MIRGRFAWCDVRAGWRDEQLVRGGVNRGTIGGAHRGWSSAGVGALDYRIGWLVSYLTRR